MNRDQPNDPARHLEQNASWRDVEAAEDLSNLREPAYSIRFGPWRVAFRGFLFHCHDLLSFYYSARDIFLDGIYDFGEITGPARIIDGGAHIGLFSLFAAQRAPQALITAFEPNPASLALLRRNLECNGVAHRCRIVESGLAAKDGATLFSASSSDDSTLYLGDKGATIATTRLSPYLEKPVDVLKLNIEGAESEVMEDSECRLPAAGKIFIEYHGFPELPQTLHRICAVLDRTGFRYCLGAMDKETNPACHPPFKLGSRRFFNLIYAERRETPGMDANHTGA